MNYEILLFGAISIVGLAEWLKSFDKKDIYKNLYNFLPLVLAIPVSVIITIYVKNPWYMGFMYWGVEISLSVIGYSTIIKTINKLVQK